jgi:hypothetical protein
MASSEDRIDVVWPYHSAPFSDLATPLEPNVRWAHHKDASSVHLIAETDSLHSLAETRYITHKGIFAA